MVGNVRNMGLTSLDDLFKSEQERQQDTHERILNIPVGEIYPYARQPYSIKRPTPDLVRLMDSIEQVGVAEPLIVRPRTEGGYEISEKEPCHAADRPDQETAEAYSANHDAP